VKEPESEEFPWFALHARLETIASFTKTHHAAMVRGLEKLPTSTRRDMAIRYVSSFDEEIRIAMVSWKTGAPIPQLEGEALSFLRFRATTAASFVLALNTPDNLQGRIIAPGPRYSIDRLAKWFLTEWWQHSGCIYGAQSLLSAM
jgi:hypothetical protein